MSPRPDVASIAVIACGALYRELRAVLGQLGTVATVELLPANLHNRPERITGEVEAVITRLHAEHGPEVRIVVAYADCGTGGHLDAMLQQYDIPRLPGAHCYEFFAGGNVFAELSAASLGTFYLTDFLALHFEALVWDGLGLNRHPTLRDVYFGHYERVLFISQQKNVAAEAKAVAAAKQLGLRYEQRHTGLEPFSETLKGAMKPLGA
jgi:hypothetical protein